MNIESYSRRRVLPVQPNWDDDKGWWSRRSGLEKKLLILLIIIIVVAGGFFIFFSIKHSMAPKICITPGCLLAASQIISHIDPTTDPCEDFAKFACGKLIQNTHGDVEAALELSHAGLLQRQLKELMEDPVEDDDHYLVRKQKEMFQACMNETAVEDESLDVFKETLEELQGWPVVVDYKWKARQFDWKDMIHALRERGYYHSMMLFVLLKPHPTHQNQYVVNINQPMVKLVKNEHRELYKKYMVDVAMWFGAEKNLAVNEMEEVLVFMKKLRRIAAKYRINDGDSVQPLTVEDFQNHNNQIDWLDFINNLIYPASLTSDDEVMFLTSGYVTAFFNLIHGTPKRTQANYIVWSVLEDIMPFMSKELKQLKSNYTCLTETSSTTRNRFDFCQDLMETSFHPGPLEVLHARKYLGPEKKEQAQELFDSIQAEFVATLRDSSWLDEETKEKIVETADEVVGVIGVQGDYFNDTIFEQFGSTNYTYEEEDEETREGFFAMLLKSKRQLADALFSLLDLQANETVISFLNEETSALYFINENVIVVKPGILQGIFYDQDRPMYLNYGAIGSLIAQELSHNLGKSFNDYRENITEIPWTKETQNAFEEHLECFSKETEPFDLPAPESHVIDVKISKYSGPKIAYAAYARWLSQNEPEPHLPGFDYTPNQLFWISSMAPQCFTIDLDDLDAVFEATGPMRNNPDFSNDFRCPAESKMNPSEKCQIFYVA